MEPTIAEAMTAWYATEINKKMGVSYCILEGDVKEITHAQQRDSLWRGSYCMLVDEASKILKKKRDWCVIHVFRQANDTAHKLAKLAISIREEIL